MFETRRPPRLGWITAAGVAALVIAGCGSSPAPAQTLPASGKPPGPGVTLVAQDIAFDSTEVGAPANQPFTIILENREAVPHDVAIDGQGPGQGRAFEGAVVTGPATRWYSVPPLAPGEYVFVCTIHPAMTGRLVAS